MSIATQNFVGGRFTDPAEGQTEPVVNPFPLASEMPHGGFKQSGYGLDLSMYALEDYTEVKHVMVSLS